MNIRRISQAGIDLIKRWEGTKLEAYQDPAGHLTIGTGHLLTKSERHSGKLEIGGRTVRWREGLTEAQAEDLLRQDVEWVEECVNDKLGQKRAFYLTQNRFDVLCDFVFNFGCSAFAKSTLLRVILEGEYDQVPTQLRRWKYADGKVLQGLINRREDEVAIWSMSAQSTTCPRCGHHWTT